MKTKKVLVSILSFVLMLSMSLFAVACAAPPVITLDLSEDAVVLYTDAIGETYELSATAKENDVEVTDPVLTWASDAEEVVTVEDGVITIVGKGTSTITCTYKDKTAECEVTVNDSTLTLSETVINAIVGGEDVTVTATVANGETPVETPTLTWSSDAEGVATVANGVISIVGEGTANITCTYAAVSSTVVVNVYVPDLSISAESIEATERDEAVQLTVSASVNSVPVENPVLVWSTTNAKVAAVENGLVSFKGAGEATITASLGATSISCSVAVSAVEIEIDSNEEFIAEIGSGKPGTYKLTKDIVITDALATGDTTEGAFQSGAYMFGKPFIGTLDANGYTMTFNADTRDIAYFTGVFASIKGTIKNANIVISVTSPTNGGHSMGLLAERHYGVIDNCFINYTNKGVGGSGYGYISLINMIMDGSEIKNSVIVDYSAYVEGGIVAEYAESTAKITNVGVASNSKFWYPDMDLAQALPSNKCVVNGFYVYQTLAKALSGDAAVSLNSDKYNADDTPARITWTTSDCADENIAVLFDTNVTKQLSEIVSIPDGFNVVQLSADVYVNAAASKMDAIIMVDPANLPATEINSSSEFIAAMKAGELKRYVLKTDVSVTDTDLGGTDEIQSGGKTFDTFNGVLDGAGHTMTFNIKANGYFKGIFKTFAGTFKNANIVMSVQTAYGSGNKLGALAETFTGIIDNCVITMYTKSTSGYGHGSLVATLGATAQITNCVLNVQDAYIATSFIAYNVSETAKVQNIAIVSNKLHSPGLQMSYLLPNGKCDIKDIYIYNSLNNLVAGKADYVLDLNKYNADGAPLNITYNADADIDVLYSRGPVDRTISQFITTDATYVVGTVNVIKVINETATINTIVVQQSAAE